MKKREMKNEIDVNNNNNKRQLAQSPCGLRLLSCYEGSELWDLRLIRRVSGL